ncbi:MAG: cytochrome C oxidase subunit IV family protein [Phycisphaerales bacterium]
MDSTEHTKAENVAALGWDPDDPHGINPHHGEHHHFIADWRMQVSILAILLFFTFLTVAFFRLETWAEVAFGIHLPGWVNIVGAMSIATIKGVLVAAFFMQLKYDKVLNTFVLLFCLLCVGLFLGFSMIDLGSRHLVNPIASGEISKGGTGYGLNSASVDEGFKVRMSPKVNTQGLGIIYEARLTGTDNPDHHYWGLQKFRDDPNHSEAEFWEMFYGDHAEYRDPMDEHDYFTQLGYGHHDEISDANKSRGRTGITPGLFSDVTPTDHGDGGSHDDGH